MALFVVAETHPLLLLRTTLNQNGVIFEVALRFVAALPEGNWYRLCFDGSWPAEPANAQDYFRRSSAGWLDYWTRDWTPEPPPGTAAAPGVSALYRALAEDAQRAEAHLTGAGEIQVEILRAMKTEGAWYSLSHKEGDTRMAYTNGRFITASSGEYVAEQAFETDEAFLAYLRRFYEWKTSRSRYPAKPSDYETWKLTLRLLRRPAAAAHVPSADTSGVDL